MAGNICEHLKGKYERFVRPQNLAFENWNILIYNLYSSVRGPHVLLSPITSQLGVDYNCP